MGTPSVTLALSALTTASAISITGVSRAYQGVVLTNLQSLIDVNKIFSSSSSSSRWRLLRRIMVRERLCDDLFFTIQPLHALIQPLAYWIHLRRYVVDTHSQTKKNLTNKGILRKLNWYMLLIQIFVIRCFWLKPLVLNSATWAPLNIDENTTKLEKWNNKEILISNRTPLMKQQSANNKQW